MKFAMYCGLSLSNRCTTDDLGADSTMSGTGMTSSGTSLGTCEDVTSLKGHGKKVNGSGFCFTTCLDVNTK